MENSRQEISLCMITRNEERNLGRCLSHAADLASEIIIVDTGSKDRTKEVAKEFGAKVYDFQWKDDFAAARNFGLDRAKKEWILVLDADEYLEEGIKEKLLELINRPQAPDIYLLPIKNLLVPHRGEWDISLALRLFKNSFDLRYRGKIHEQIIVPKGKKVEVAEKGPVIIHLGYADGRRDEKNLRNMSILEKALLENPENPYYQFYMSTEHIIRGDCGQALIHLRKALPKIPQEVLLFRTAAVRNAFVCLTELGCLDEAERLLKQELNTFKDFPDYHFYLGNVYLAKGCFLKAIFQFETALSITDPPLVGCSTDGSNGYKAWFYKGLAEVSLRRVFEAINSFTKALQENPNFDPALYELVKCLSIVADQQEGRDYLDSKFEIVSPTLSLLVAEALLPAEFPLSGDCIIEEKDNHLSLSFYLKRAEVLISLSEKFQAQVPRIPGLADIKRKPVGLGW